MSYIVFGIGAGLCLLAMVILLAVLRIHRGRRSQQQDDVPPRKNGPQDQPGKGGKGGKGGGRAALHTSHASLISNVHDYEDVTDDAVSQIQDPHSRKGSKDSAPGAALPDSGMYTHFPSHGSSKNTSSNNYSHFKKAPASASPTSGDDYNVLNTAVKARHQSDPPGNAKVKAATLPRDSASAGNIFDVGDEADNYTRLRDGDIYEILEDGRVRTPVPQQRGEAEEVYQDCLSPRPDTARSAPRPTAAASPHSSPLLTRAGSWKRSWRRRNKEEQGESAMLADLDVTQLALPRDPSASENRAPPLNPFCPPQLPTSLPPRLRAKETNLRRKNSRSVDNVSPLARIKAAGSAHSRAQNNRPKSMDLSQLDLPGLMLTNQNTDLRFSRRLGDGAETVPTLINDHNDEGDYEEIPNFCPPYPATQQPEAQLPTTLASPEGLPSGPVSPTALPQSRSRGDLAPMRVAPTPAGRAGQPQDSAPPVVVMRRKANGSSPKKSAQKPPLPESGDLSVEQQRQLLLLNTGLLALETAVRKSMEIQDDELVMIDNALYGTLPRRGSLPTTEL